MYLSTIIKGIVVKRHGWKCGKFTVSKITGMVERLRKNFNVRKKGNKTKESLVGNWTRHPMKKTDPEWNEA